MLQTKPFLLVQKYYSKIFNHPCLFSASFLNTGEDRHFPTKQSAICLCAFQAAILCRGAFFFNFEPLSGSTLVSKKGSCFGLKVEEKSCFHKQLPSPVQFWSKVRGNKERFMRAAARTKIQMVNGKEW